VAVLAGVIHILNKVLVYGVILVIIVVVASLLLTKRRL
jgi:hypothetical protein